MATQQNPMQHCCADTANPYAALLRWHSKTLRSIAALSKQNSRNEVDRDIYNYHDS